MIESIMVTNCYKNAKDDWVAVLKGLAYEQYKGIEFNCGFQRDLRSIVRSLEGIVITEN